MIACAPASSTRLIVTLSFHGGRTTAVAVPPASACICWISAGTSLGECSMSSTIQSKPAGARISATTLSASCVHSPTWGRPSASPRLKALRGMSMPLPRNPLRRGALSARITAASRPRPMSRRRHRLAVAALAAALASCAPTHEWVNPAANMEARDLDTRDCNARAWDYAQQRRFLYGGDYRLGSTAMGGVGWSQNNTVEALDRNRYFEDCMRLRGYTQQPIKQP